MAEEADRVREMVGAEKEGNEGRTVCVVSGWWMRGGVGQRLSGDRGWCGMEVGYSRRAVYGDGGGRRRTCGG